MGCRIKKHKNCAVCGVVFIPKSGRGVLCSQACRTQRVREQRRSNLEFIKLDEAKYKAHRAYHNRKSKESADRHRMKRRAEWRAYASARRMTEEGRRYIRAYREANKDHARKRQLEYRKRTYDLRAEYEKTRYQEGIAILDAAVALGISDPVETKGRHGTVVQSRLIKSAFKSLGLLGAH